MHSVTEIKEAAHNYSLINVFFPPCNKEGNCKFVIRQVFKFSKNAWVFFSPLSWGERTICCTLCKSSLGPTSLKSGFRNSCKSLFIPIVNSFGQAFFTLKLQDMFESSLSLELHGKRLAGNPIPPVVSWYLSTDHLPESSTGSIMSTIGGASLQITSMNPSSRNPVRTSF